MKIPIMEPATGIYLEVIKEYIKFRQLPLMSADYILHGKRYKLVGLYKKGLFGGVSNRMLMKFMVVEQNGTIIKDVELSKKILEFYCTFESLWLCEKRIEAALKHDPKFYEEILEEAEDITNTLVPVMKKMRLGEEKYQKSFQHFFDVLRLWNEKSIVLKRVARELSDPLQLILNREAVDEEMYKKVKNLVIQFVNDTDIRSIALIDLYLEGSLFSVKVILSEADSDKTINLTKYKKSIENMKLIVRESTNAIQTTRMDGIAYANTTDLNKIKEVIQKRLYPKEDMITDYANEIMREKWVFHK
ncbi:MAG TPA: hypothetical protein VEY68_13860 [Anoxybacillus sp.]|nr:hypothetical protein [Anoxybacillus sp.]